MAVVPSIIWLLFFVLQKKHREKTKDIVKVFLWGISIALPVVILEDWSIGIFAEFAANLFITPFLMGFVAVSFIEEFAKYVVVRTKAMPYAFFDEPQDAIIYMITAALGFAGIENFVYVLVNTSTPDMVIGMTILRGVSANFLHVVASGFLGYFLALSIEHPREKRRFLYTGIIGATLLHGVFNNFIMELSDLISESSCSYVFGLVLEAGTKCTEEIFGIALIGTLLTISGIIILIGLYKLAHARFPRRG
ncbi:MAG: PrsW family intramembrane metalloprotease [Candidatus Spechtbacterales bacterium]